ncbi:MAG: cytochrome c3 family protein [Planctomycetota bacterium]
MRLPAWVRRKTIGLLTAGAGLGVLAVAVAAVSIEHSSSDAFCMSCHEMRVVAEQGWMHSAHYQNDGGVVAGCADCHVPPELVPKLWVKTRDGVKDVYVHFLGESDPQQMDWDDLAVSARAKIYDSACRKCHQNLTPDGASIATLVAHRENQRLEEPKRCLDCHDEEFHGRFRLVLGQPAKAGEGSP